MKKIPLLKKIWFWLKYFPLMLLFGIMSAISVPIFPLAYFFRIKLGWDLFWPFLNDETLSGERWWLLKYKLDPKSFWTKWRWNIRNTAWNFKLLFKPTWVFKHVKNFTTIYSTTINKWGWPNRDKPATYGFDFIFYTVFGKVYSRLGYANKWFELQMGSAGNRYKFRMKPVWVPISIILIIIALFYYF